MNIKFSIEMTEKNIPELMGLLVKMWDNPDPAASIVVEQKCDASVLKVKALQPVAEPIDVPITKEQLQLAAGTFMAKDMNNLAILQTALQTIGAKAVPSLRDDQLEPFAQKLRELGVAI